VEIETGFYEPSGGDALLEPHIKLVLQDVKKNLTTPP